MSQPYVNPDGVAFGACHYCGYCERFGCEVNAKASAHFTVIPLAAQKKNVEMRTNARVMKVNLDAAKKRAESVTYIDAAGREFEQPGDLVVLCAYALGNVHLMLLSGIGKPYDPATGDGVVGRNYAYQIGSGATVFFDEKTWMNPFMGAGALSRHIDDFNTGSFDHVREGFIGGGGISTPSATGRPIGFRPVPPGTPTWGTEWKRAVVRHYNHTLGINNQGSVMSYRQNYLDLDPTYRDRYGRPLHAHDVRLSCERAEAGELHCRHLREDRAGDGCRARRAARVRRSATASSPIKARTTPAARRWGPIRRPARSIAIVRPGTCRMCSSPAPALSRKTPARTQPALSARSPIGPRMPSSAT